MPEAMKRVPNARQPPNSRRVSRSRIFSLCRQAAPAQLPIRLCQAAGGREHFELVRAVTQFQSDFRMSAFADKAGITGAGDSKNALCTGVMRNQLENHKVVIPAGNIPPYICMAKKLLEVGRLRESAMKSSLYIFAIFAGGLLAAQTPVSALPDDPYPWCAQYADDGGGGTNCGFRTFDQCRSTVSGLGGGTN